MVKHSSILRMGAAAVVVAGALITAVSAQQASTAPTAEVEAQRSFSELGLQSDAGLQDSTLAGGTGPGIPIGGGGGTVTLPENCVAGYEWDGTQCIPSGGGGGGDREIGHCGVDWTPQCPPPEGPAIPVVSGWLCPVSNIYFHCP